MGFLWLPALKPHKWTRRFVAEMEKLAAPLLKQSDNGTHEQKAV
jgi:hypothetical protein